MGGVADADPRGRHGLSRDAATARGAAAHPSAASVVNASGPAGASICCRGVLGHRYSCVSNGAEQRGGGDTRWHFVRRGGRGGAVRACTVPFYGAAIGRVQANGVSSPGRGSFAESGSAGSLWRACRSRTSSACRARRASGMGRTSAALVDTSGQLRRRSSRPCASRSEGPRATTRHVGAR